MEYPDTEAIPERILTSANGDRYSARLAVPWGKTGCPIVPAVYRIRYSDVDAPTTLMEHVQDTSLSLEDLGKSFWYRTSSPALPEKLRQEVGRVLGRMPIPAGTIAIPAGLPMDWVADLPLRTRTVNAITRFVAENGGGPLDRALLAQEVMEWKAVGNGSLIDLLCVLESAELGSQAPSAASGVTEISQSADRAAMPATGVVSRLPSRDGNEEIADPTGEYLRDVAAWALSETPAVTVGDALGYLMGKESPPEEWKKLSRLRLVDVCDPPAHPYRAVQSWVDRLPGREQMIFMDRFGSAEGRPTLKEVGNRVKLTRERVRQLEHRLFDRFSAYMETHRGRYIKWRVETVRLRTGFAAPLDQVAGLLAPPDPRYDYSFLFRRLAGPYVESEDWLVLKHAIGGDPTAAIMERTDEIGCIKMEEAREALREWGLPHNLHIRWLTRRDRCRLIDGMLVRWRGPLGGKLAFSLNQIGAPATVTEIRDSLDLEQTPRSIQNILRLDERFVRYSRKEWGLRWWGLAEYKGMASTIRHLLEQRGPMPINDVVDG